MSLSAEDTSAYLERLGFSSAPAINFDGLRALHVAHLHRVPFENLDIHRNTPIVLEEARIVDKIVRRRRGGFCYELNGAFAALLEGLGFAVSRHEARVYNGDDLGIRYDHLCLEVDLDEPYLADVGFGGCFEEPLRLVVGVEQADPWGTFEVRASVDGDGLDLVQDGTRQYRFDLTPHALADFTPGCEYHQHSPESHFTKGTVCSIATDDGRVTIADHLLIETRGADRTERQLSDDELATAYRTYFGFED